MRRWPTQRVAVGTGASRSGLARHDAGAGDSLGGYRAKLGELAEEWTRLSRQARRLRILGRRRAGGTTASGGGCADWGSAGRAALCDDGWAMTDPSLLDRLRAARVVPVVRTHSAAHAATGVAGCATPGMRIFEITMTMPDAPALIRELAADPTCWSARARCPTRRPRGDLPGRRREASWWRPGWTPRSPRPCRGAWGGADAGRR